MYPQSMFRAKKEKYSNFLSENYFFYCREKLQYITWACFRNGIVSVSIVIINGIYRNDELSL